MVLPVEVAFSVQPWHVEPGGRAEGSEISVVVSNVRSAIVDQRPMCMSMCSGQVQRSNAHVNGRLCCSSYLSLVKPLRTVLPSAIFSSSLQAAMARCRSSIAPVFGHQYALRLDPRRRRVTNQDNGPPITGRYVCEGCSVRSGVRCCARFRKDLLLVEAILTCLGIVLHLYPIRRLLETSCK